MNLFDFLQHLVQVPNDPTVAQQNLSFGVRYHHERQRRDPEGIIGLAFFIRDHRERDMELFFVGGDLLIVVSGSNTEELDIPAQNRIFLDRIE